MALGDSSNVMDETQPTQGLARASGKSEKNMTPMGRSPRYGWANKAAENKRLRWKLLMSATNK